MNKDKIVQKHIQGIKKHARKQQLRDARRKTNLRSNPRKPRHKKVAPNDWGDWDDLDEMEFDAYQPIISKGENERRREIEKTITDNISDGKDKQTNTPQKTNSTQHDRASFTALVVETGSGMCRVDLDGQTILCDIRGNVKDAVTGYVNPVAVGDQVLVTINNGQRGIVEGVLPRRSVLARPYSPDAGKIIDGLHQIVVANVDRILIVASWREPFIWPALIDRYLIAAQRNQIEAVICINKVDLIEDPLEFHEMIQPYQELEFQFLQTSIVTGKGIEKLRTMLQDSTTVLAGLSGVGKSSILTAMQPSLDLKTRHVSEHGLFTGQGRHTTTQSSLWKLENGGVVIDTPGVRNFGVAGIYAAGLASWYPEMVAFAGQCRYGNCSHTIEPNCAIKNAVAQGAISALRYKNYTQIYEELSSHEN